MEVVGAACGLVPCLWPLLKEQINYVKNPKKNFTKLEKDVEALCKLKDDIGREIARDTSKILSGECKKWTEKVDEFETEVNKIKEEVDENRRCLNRCCFPDICARRKVVKRVVTMLEDVAKLNEAVDFKEPKYVDAPATVVEEIPVPDIKGGETTVERTVKRIMQSIMDAKIKKIGLWGMGGVGKTTALESLNNHSEIAQTFEVVIWVTVSKEGSVRKVRNEIAQRLKMDIQPSESDQSTARKLHEKLKSMKYLLLLDDLWSPVNLEEVGIPLMESKEGSKVVLTTRFLDVCRDMESHEEIKVECLSEEEAWDLFHEKAGGVVDSTSIEPIAKDVAKECAGLPLAVVVTGKSLRKVEDVHVWQNALNHLQKATFRFRDTEAQLFEQLKLSYDRLKDDEQSCFLYCALYPEDHKIPVVELVERWRAEGFLDSDGMDSLDDAVAGGHTKVENLVDACLLERSVDYSNCDCVKMHDVLRDLALRIASSKFLVRAGLGIEECPYDEKEWEEARRISLMWNELSGGLPPNPRCNELSTLLLNGNRISLIPDMFFQHMPSLRVLDLNGTGIKVVPASVSNLVNLRGLYAKSWRVAVDLPREIGALKKLEVLEVNVGSLPIEVRQLTSLRRLWVQFYKDTEEEEDTEEEDAAAEEEEDTEEEDDVAEEEEDTEEEDAAAEEEEDTEEEDDAAEEEEDTEEDTKEGTEEGMKTICSNGVISSLFQLEDLIIDYYGGNLRKKWCKVVDESRVGEEVGRLKRLTRLEFDFSRIECLEHFLAQRNTNSCPELKIFHVSMSSERESSSEVKMSHIISQRLEECQVKDCPAMETIVESNGPSTSTTNVTTVLLNLKKLRLEWLPNLKSICEDPRHRFTKLTMLYIQKCPKLSYVFTQGMIQHMPNLEVLHVSYCEGIEEIVMREDVEYCEVQQCPAMETIVVESNGPSTSTTNVTTVLLNLKELRLSNLPNLKSICEDPRHRFTKLTELYIVVCPKLSCVFTQGMIQHMPNLEVLSVSNCEGIEEIVMREDVEVANCEGIEEIVMREDVEETNHHHLQLIFFPKLRLLGLVSCQNLVRIWKGASQPWPSIQEIKVLWCPNLENLNLNAVDDQNPLAALKLIFGETEWWEALKWEDEKSKHRLQPFFIKVPREY